jgi:2-polyprenyl-6-methoxyphenol hydroxylase-like FAD-dependent oxidoreductase
VLGLGQSRSEPVLREILIREYGIAVELATELVKFEQAEDSVTCELAKTSTDGHRVEERARFDWLVGADGARGTFRRPARCFHLTSPDRCCQEAAGVNL